MNNYQKTAKEYVDTITSDIESIFKSGLNPNKLVLKLGDENLFELEDNVIKSSTAIGYCMEEYIVKKLLKLNAKRYERAQGSRKSYDLISNINGIIIMTNFKSEAKGSSNLAISALKNIIKDYSCDEKEKLFLTFKINYVIEKK